MRVDTMRKIDYWVGVPLCFISSLFLKFKSFILPSFKIIKKNILLIELSEMGSTILVDPAMQKLKRELEANLFFVIFAKNESSLFLLNTVSKERIFTLRQDNLFNLIIDTFRFLKWTRKQGIDTVIDLELFSRFTALLAGFCGAEHRVGFHAFHNEGLYRGGMLTHRVAYNPHIHIAKNFIALVNALLCSEKEVPYSKSKIEDNEIKLRTIEFDASQTDAIRSKIHEVYSEYSASRHRIVLINPNASELLIQRRWMPEYYIALMKLVVAQFADVLILVTGAPSEREEAQQLCSAVNHPQCINFAGQLKLVELPILYSISTLMVSNDSGPGHFSSITNMPSFILFGPETPTLYGSLGNSIPIYAGLACSPCVSASNHRKTACTDNKCLQVIQPNYVFEQIRPLLKNPSC